MMELHWTPEAIQDREAIYEYIEADNPTAALALEELFEEKAGRLVDHPGLGRRGSSEHKHFTIYEINDAWRCHQLPEHTNGR